MSRKRIRRIDPLQAGKVAGILAAALLLLIFVPFALLLSLSGIRSSIGAGLAGMSLLVALFMPLLYGLLAFLIGMLCAALYNLTYRYHGGLEMEYDELEDDIDRIGR